MSDMTTTARPYARAIFELAKAGSTQDNWTEVLAILSAVVDNADMREALDSPKLSAEQKGELLIDVCNDKLSDENRNAIKLLAENGRLSLMPEIAELFEAFRAEDESKVEATVTSAFPLTDAQQTAIVAALKKKLGCDITLVTQTDKTLIGGVVIRAGDLVIDGSTQARLSALSQSLSH